jgi:uncharacterized protein (DUF885 family)
MSEDTKTQEQITKEEVAKLHAEIQAKESQTLDGVKKDVAEAVKKDLKQEQDFENMRKQNEDLQKALEEQQKATEAKLAEVQKEMASKIEDIATSQKSVRSNNNPFEAKEGDDSDMPVNIHDPAIQKEIEEESRRAFIEKYKVDSSFGSPQ